MLVMLLGMIILLRPVQFWNAEFATLVTPLAIVTLTKLEQDEKAELPMLATVPGIAKLVRPMQP